MSFKTKCSKNITVPQKVYEKEKHCKYSFYNAYSFTDKKYVVINIAEQIISSDVFKKIMSIFDEDNAVLCK